MTIDNEMKNCEWGAVELRQKRGTESVNKLSNLANIHFMDKAQKAQQEVPCYVCEDTNHIAKKNWKKHKLYILSYIEKGIKRDSNLRMYIYADDNDNQLLADCFTLEALLQIWTLNYTTTPIVVTPILFGKPIQMELNTGSNDFLISNSNLDLYLLRYKIAKIRIKTYSGEQIRPLGKINVDVQINEHSANLDLVFVRQVWPTLFDHD